jgi:DNA-binding NarL/FixJ family response regulator
MDDDPEDVRQLRDAGIAGLVHKDAPARDLVAVIRAAVRGDAVLDESAAPAPSAGSRRMLRETSGHRPIDLTGRQMQLLRRLTYGESNKEIARALGLAEKTVRNHFGGIFAKLGVADRTQAALLAVRSGLCDGSPVRHLGRRMPPAADAQ